MEFVWAELTLCSRVLVLQSNRSHSIRMASIHQENKQNIFQSSLALPVLSVSCLVNRLVFANLLVFT